MRAAWPVTAAAQFVDAFIVGERAADGDFSEHFHPLNFQHLQQVFTEVTVGGPLSNNKGINKLGGGLSAEALTDKDKAFWHHSLRHGPGGAHSSDLRHSVGRRPPGSQRRSGLRSGCDGRCDPRL
jgi:hypothetical protein